MDFRIAISINTHWRDPNGWMINIAWTSHHIGRSLFSPFIVVFFSLCDCWFYFVITFCFSLFLHLPLSINLQRRDVCTTTTMNDAKLSMCICMRFMHSINVRKHNFKPISRSHKSIRIFMINVEQIALYMFQINYIH